MSKPITDLDLPPFEIPDDDKTWDDEELFPMDSVDSDEDGFFIDEGETPEPKTACSFVTGAAGTGKAQPGDAKVLTPDGWITMYEIKLGDYVITDSGERSKVLAKHPQGVKDVYRVTFQDESATECCLDHLWLTRTAHDRANGCPGTVRSLREIQASLFARPDVRTHLNHSIPMCREVEFAETEVPIDPYLLGVLIGDGCLTAQATLVSYDEEIVKSCAAAIPEGMNLHQITAGGRKGTYQIGRNKRDGIAKISPFLQDLRELGLFGKKSSEKFVPAIYKVNSFHIRLSILQGLMDTDGTVSKDGTSVTFTTCSHFLASDVRFLVQSLGGTAVVRSRVPFFSHKGEQRIGQRAFTLHIALPAHVSPFRLIRKAQRVRPRTKYPPRRFVETLEYARKAECYCITIDSLSCLYLTDEFIVTHNSFEINRRLVADPSYALLCATTGIAAVNLGEGCTTINSALGYFDTASLEQNYMRGRIASKLRRISNMGFANLVIDEVSMMNAEQLDIITRAVDEYNCTVNGKRQPLGLVLTGDFMQLSPVSVKGQPKAKWAFESDSWGRYDENTLRLTKCWRQSDADFLAALTAMRQGDRSTSIFNLARCNVDYADTVTQDFPGTTIIATNDGVERHNFIAHQKVIGRMTRARSSRWGKQRSEWKLIPDVLEIKIGSYVMILANNRLNYTDTSFQYVNGDCGTVVDIDKTSGVYLVELRRDGCVVRVAPVTRRNEQKEKPKEEIAEAEAKQAIGQPCRMPYRNPDSMLWCVGEVTYMPLRLAYAATVHKVQGITLDAVQINLDHTFFGAPAMTYVAVSRCREASGLRIVGSPELLSKRISTEPKVLRFL